MSVFTERVETAVEQVTDDPWLVRQVRARAKGDSVWGVVCALSLIDRLYDPPRGVRLVALSRMLNEGVSGLPEPGLELVRELTAVGRMMVAVIATISAVRLAIRLKIAFSMIDPEDAEWCQRMEALLKHRDELDGVHRLLQCVSRGRLLGWVLDQLDKACRVGAHLPEFDIEDVEQLDRSATEWAGSGQPAPWWIRAVVALCIDDDDAE